MQWLVPRSHLVQGRLGNVAFTSGDHRVPSWKPIIKEEDKMNNGDGAEGYQYLPQMKLVIKKYLIQYIQNIIISTCN